MTKNIDNFNIYERNYLENNFKDMHNSIGIISYETLSLELPSEAPSFPLWKEIFPTTAVTFYTIEQPLNPLPWDVICKPLHAICGLLNA